MAPWGAVATKKIYIRTALLMSVVVLYGEVTGYGFHYGRFNSQQETYVVGFVMCRCFGNMSTCIYCVFLFFLLGIFILICY